MIKICIMIEKENTSIKGFTIKGHAGAGKPGKDIVCSAVSAVAYTALGALANYDIKYDCIKESGNMQCILSDELTDEEKKIAQIILYSINVGFIQIEQSSRKYVSVCKEEV